MLAKYGCWGVSPTTTLTMTPLGAFVWSNCQQNGKFSRAFSGNSGEGLQTPPPVASEKRTLLPPSVPRAKLPFLGGVRSPQGGWPGQSMEGSGSCWKLPRQLPIELKNEPPKWVHCGKFNFCLLPPAALNWPATKVKLGRAMETSESNWLS